MIIFPEKLVKVVKTFDEFLLDLVPGSLLLGEIIKDGLRIAARAKFLPFAEARALDFCVVYF